MDEQEWYNGVRKVISEHPEWLATTNAAITAGVKDRLASETDARANAEASLIVCFDAAGKERIPANQLEMVRSAIKNSKLVGGTKYAESA